MMKKLWNDPIFRYSLLGAALFTLAAHAYAYFNNFFSHDALNAIYASAVEEGWKLQLGRFLFPLYRTILRGSLALPWVIGLFTILWGTLAVYLLAKIFDLKSFVSILLTAGVLLVNRTVICLTSTYIYELDIDMLSVLLAVLSVWLWKKTRWGFLTGALPIVGVLGIYQCNLSVVIVLVIFVSVLTLLMEPDSFMPVLKKGLLSLLMIALGLALYYLILQAILALAGTQLVENNYNSITNAFAAKSSGLFSLLRQTYRNYFDTLFAQETSYPLVLVSLCRYVILAATAVMLVLQCLRTKPALKNLLLAAVLLVLIPLGANAAHLLNDGRSHDLMKYAIYVTALFPILLAERMPKPEVEGSKKRLVLPVLRPAVMVLVFILLFNNTLTANSIYLKKHFEQQATLSVMTRIVYDLDRTEGYVPGESPICFIGVPNLTEAMPGFERYYSFTGSWARTSLDADTVLPYYHTYAAYFNYFLNEPARFCTPEEYQALKSNESVLSSPIYPDSGAFFWVDGVLVIHLS